MHSSWTENLGMFCLAVKGRDSSLSSSFLPIRESSDNDSIIQTYFILSLTNPKDFKCNLHEERKYSSNCSADLFDMETN
jgi:hypothetical protein